MSDKTTSPFSGLDKALLRSTQRRSPAPPEAPQQQEVDNLPAPTTTPSTTTTQANQHASKPASMIASYHNELTETIRKAVKVPGREVSFVRLTAEEKAQLADIVYTFKRRGKRTSENEINRIAINFILQDYKANQEDSILARVIDALLA